MLEQAGVSAVRVKAFDGTTSAIEYASRYAGSGSNTACLVESDSTVDSSTLLFTDDYSHIPESDVELTWDTTLNAQFDKRYQSTTRVTSTPSERACAASHLRVWRAIAAVRAGTSSSSGGGGRTNQPKNPRGGPAKAGKQGPDSSAQAEGEEEEGKGKGKGEEKAGAEAVSLAPDEVYRSLSALALPPHKDAQSSTTAAIVAAAAASKKGSNAPDGLLLCERIMQIDEDLDYYLVLEDDVQIPHQNLASFATTVKALMRQLPSHIDVLYLNGCIPNTLKTPRLKEHFIKVSYVWTMQAYVLRGRAVEVLLSKLPMFAPVDNFVASLIHDGELEVGLHCMGLYVGLVWLCMWRHGVEIHCSALCTLSIQSLFTCVHSRCTSVI
jgi:hypothetical protein